MIYRALVEEILTPSDPGIFKAEVSVHPVRMRRLLVAFVAETLLGVDVALNWSKRDRRTLCLAIIVVVEVADWSNSFVRALGLLWVPVVVCSRPPSRRPQPIGRRTAGGEGDDCVRRTRICLPLSPSDSRLGRAGTDEGHDRRRRRARPGQCRPASAPPRRH